MLWKNSVLVLVLVVLVVLVRRCSGLFLIK